MPLRNYRADIDLTPTATGTSIRWHSTFSATMPGTGWFYRAVLSAFIARCASGLAATPPPTKPLLQRSSRLWAHYDHYVSGVVVTSSSGPASTPG